MFFVLNDEDDTAKKSILSSVGSASQSKLAMVHKIRNRGWVGDMLNSLQYFYVDGFLDDNVLHNNLPIFTITDNFGRKVFQVKINPDPGVQSITCTSELNSVNKSTF